MNMDTKLSLSPAMTNILQNKPPEHVREPKFHPCFKQYSDLCNSSLIVPTCSFVQSTEKNKKNPLQHKELLHLRSLDWYCFTKTKPDKGPHLKESLENL